MCIAETWLNVEYVAKTEGLVSSLAFTVVVGSVGAAGALPFMERSFKAHRWLSAIGLTLFFLLMSIFSMGASLDRIASKRDTEKAFTHTDNVRVELEREAYKAAKKTAQAESTRNEFGERRRKQKGT